MDAARFFMRHHGRGITGKLVADAVEAFKAEKQAEGRSRLYLDDLRYRLDDFAQAFNVEVRQLTPADVRDFLNELKFSARSFNNHRGRCKRYSGSAKGMAGFPRKRTCLKVLASGGSRRRTLRFSPQRKYEGYSHAAAPKAATCIALQAFAGVRSEELLRLTWQDLERRRGFIEITAGKAKTAQRRLIPIASNLAEWLSDAPRNGKRIWPHSKPYLFEAIRDTTAKAKVAWKANGLRHSFISYRLAQTKDMAAVALEAGNSPVMIFRHYRELATDEEAKEWFGLRPSRGAANAIRLSA